MGRSWGAKGPAPLRSLASSWAPGTSASLRTQSPRCPVPLTARIDTGAPDALFPMFRGAPYLVSLGSPC